MASVISWLQANWVPLLVAVLAVDQVLLGIFPKNALLGNLSDILKKVLPGSSQPPSSGPPAA